MKLFFAKKSGFTLIEAILYIAIVGIIMVSIVSLHLTIGETSAKLANNIDVSRNRREALHTIDFLVRNADGMLKDMDGDCSDFNSSPQTLSLYFSDDNYLPGTCVETGGGVKISVTDSRVSLECYPNIAQNNSYQACSATLGNTYYLTDPLVVVADTGMLFSTSTVTSTISGFMSVSTNLTVTQTGFEDTKLQATSTATSTSILRNQRVSGLTSWWKLDDASVSTAVDEISGNDWTCPSAPTAHLSALHPGSLYSVLFSQPSSNTCYAPDDNALDFDDQFTLSLWVWPLSYSAGDTYLIRKESGNYGYGMYLTDTNHYIGCEVCNSSSCSQFESTYAIGTSNAFHIACSYDYHNDKVTIYGYDTSSSARATTTFSSVPALVNSTSSMGISTTTLFYGLMDDVRFYNRTLNDSEIEALRSAWE